MRYVHRSALLTCVLMAVTAPGAGAAKPPKLPHITFRFYRVTSVSGSERVDFAGDPSAGCAAHGVCGISGTETYTPDPPGATSLAFVLGLGAQEAGYIRLGTGTTTAEVTTAGADAPCTDTLEVGQAAAALAVGAAGWYAELHRPLFGALGGDDAVFATHCAGPRIPDLASAKALPRATFRRSALDRPTLALDLVSHKPFSAAGFAGHVTADVHIALRRMRITGTLGASGVDVVPPPARR